MIGCLTRLTIATVKSVAHQKGASNDSLVFIRTKHRPHHHHRRRRRHRHHHMFHLTDQTAWLVCQNIQAALNQPIRLTHNHRQAQNIQQKVQIVQ